MYFWEDDFDDSFMRSSDLRLFQQLKDNWVDRLNRVVCLGMEWRKEWIIGLIFLITNLMTL